MNIQFIDFEQGIHVSPAKEVREVLPMQNIMSSTQLKSPYGGLFYYRGNILPVVGAIPTVWDTNSKSEEHPWVVVFKDHVRVVQGLPEWREESLPINESIPLEISA